VLAGSTEASFRPSHRRERERSRPVYTWGPKKSPPGPHLAGVVKLVVLNTTGQHPLISPVWPVPHFFAPQNRSRFSPVFSSVMCEQALSLEMERELMREGCMLAGPRASSVVVWRDLWREIESCGQHDLVRWDLRWIARGARWQGARRRRSSRTQRRGAWRWRSVMEVTTPTSPMLDLLNYVRPVVLESNSPHLFTMRLCGFYLVGHIPRSILWVHVHP
jgi:hypothetical protein